MTVSVKRILVVGLALTLLVSAVPGGVLAQDGETSESTVNLDSLVALYNDNVDQAPSIARDRFAGETLEIRIGSGDTVAKKDSGQAYRFVTDDDGEITDYGTTSADDPSIRIRTSESTFEAITNAEDPAAEFNAQYDAGNIKVNGLTISKTVEVEAAKFAVWLGKTFGFL
jgi:hypothetical protein